MALDKAGSGSVEDTEFNAVVDAVVALQGSIGRPVNDDGTTYFGLPPGMSEGAHWTTYLIDNALFNGKVCYTPGLVTVPITITDVEMQIEADPGVDVTARLVIVAADSEWQPTGAALWQGTILVPDGSVSQEQFEINDLSVTLQPGLYLFGIERSGNALQTDARPATFAGAVCCEDPAGDIIQAFTATHAYGAFTDPLPRWTGLMTEDWTTSTDGWFYPFVMKWSPA